MINILEISRAESLFFLNKYLGFSICDRVHLHIKYPDLYSEFFTVHLGFIISPCIYLKLSARFFIYPHKNNSEIKFARARYWIWALPRWQITRANIECCPNTSNDYSLLSEILLRNRVYKSSPTKEIVPSKKHTTFHSKSNTVFNKTSIESLLIEEFRARRKFTFSLRFFFIFKRKVAASAKWTSILSFAFFTSIFPYRVLIRFLVFNRMKIGIKVCECG